ncbi:MAG: hypothetical protein HN764_05640 [Gammaproteobacteria bacterium]|jgi:hypothetical protein|nr:hypothetical protein [Gammaproteobacteria bacterium]
MSSFLLAYTVMQAVTVQKLDSTRVARLARIPGVSEILKIPESMEIIAFVAIGRTSQKLRASEGRRTPVGEKTFHDCYGNKY